MGAQDQTKAGSGIPDGFQGEILGAWRQLPDKPLFFGLFAAWLALFQFFGNSTLGYVDTSSLFGWLVFIYRTAPDDAHGALIPFIVAVLFWQKREELLAVPKVNWWPALFVLFLAAGLHVLSFAVQQPKGSTVAFLLGLYALMGLAWGPRWLRASFFPFVLLAFCVPLGSLAESVTFPLRMLVTKIAVAISNHVLGIHVLRDGSRIFDAQRTFLYDVAPACSGIRSLISLLALSTIYAFVYFRPAWKRGVILAAAAPLAVLGNVTRLVVIILVADAFGQNAGALVEQKFGFITFAVALGCVLGLGWLLRERKPAASETNSPPEQPFPPENSTT